MSKPRKGRVQVQGVQGKPVAQPTEKATAQRPNKPHPPKGYPDVAIAGINAVKSIFARLIDRGQFVVVLLMTILLGIIAVVTVLATRLPENEIAPFFLAFSVGLWQIATIAGAIALGLALTAYRVQGRTMQAEINRMSSEKKELQAMLIPARLDTSSASLMLDEGNKQ